MDNDYIELLRTIAETAAALAETVMEYDKKNNDTQGYNTAKTMREDYAQLAEKLGNKDLTRFDYLKLYAAAKIVCENLETKQELLRKTIQGYKISIIPKLSRVVNETQTDEQANALAMEILKTE